MHLRHKAQQSQAAQLLNTSQQLDGAQQSQTSPVEAGTDAVRQLLRKGLSIRRNALIFIACSSCVIALLSAYGIINSDCASYMIYLLMPAGYAALIVGHAIYCKALRALLRSNNESAVEPLLDALEVRTKKSRLAAEAALLRLLPQVQQTQFRLFNPTQRERLYSLLQSKNAELILVILSTLQRLEDDQALPYVLRLLSEEEKTGRDSPIKQAAQSCVLVLQAKAQGQRARQTLLRACGSTSRVDRIS